MGTTSGPLDRYRCRKQQRPDGSTVAGPPYASPRQPKMKRGRSHQEPNQPTWTPVKGNPYTKAPRTATLAGPRNHEKRPQPPGWTTHRPPGDLNNPLPGDRDKEKKTPLPTIQTSKTASTHTTQKPPKADPNHTTRQQIPNANPHNNNERKKKIGGTRRVQSGPSPESFLLSTASPPN